MLSKSKKILFMLVALFILVSALLYSFNITTLQSAKIKLQNISYFVTRGINVFQMYQNLANPYVRYVDIPAGLRKEQIADIYGKVLAWNEEDVKQFLKPANNTGVSIDGYYFPSMYVVAADASGSDVRNDMVSEFKENVLNSSSTQKSSLSKNIVNVDTAVKIASLIQREAAGKQDMNLISGIIWNRIFMGMSLDIDATLQYAKGNSEDGWWPQVYSKDKKIDSPYNTYKNKGLPPTAISNPSLAAITAAYNPQKTNCIFYFHDDDRQIHCSANYADHVKKIEQYLK